ncbi:MAG: nitroreductase family protein [Spirochaetales bacterium]
MTISEISRQRQSCRNFDSERLTEKEKIDACLNVARLTPSACNSQPWHFTVCIKQTKDTEDSVFNRVRNVIAHEINTFAKHATAFIIISEAAYNATARIGSVIKNQDYRSCDIGAVCTYFTLEAHEQGLSSCILGWFNEKKLKKICGISSKIKLIIALGYAQNDDKLRTKKRKTIEDIATWL